MGNLWEISLEYDRPAIEERTTHHGFDLLVRIILEAGYFLLYGLDFLIELRLLVEGFK